MKRFLVFILLFLVTGFTLAQDMPPLPSDAPASAAPSKDSGMPALPDAGAAPATAAGNDMPALPDAGAAPAKAAASDMPALPDSGAAPAKAAGNDMPALPDAGAASAKAAASDMPALPDASGAAPAKAASGDMPALPDAGSDAKAEAPKTAPSPTDSDMNAVPIDDGSNQAVAKPKAESQPWKASKVRPNAIFGGWIRAKGGNITSKLSWASQQALNALDAKKYKMLKEEGVYDGEQNKGPQFRKFTFEVPKSQDTVFVLMKQVGKKIWLRVGPDEEPAPADHTYAQVAKISAQSQTVLKILKAKFGSRVGPHKMVPSWDAKFDRQRESADE